MSKSTKKTGRKQAPWTAEDSTREMRKWTTMTKSAVDPSVKKVQEALEGNMDYFLENVGTIAAKYAAKMSEVLALLPLLNDKVEAAASEAAPTEEAGSPAAAPAAAAAIAVAPTTVAAVLDPSPTPHRVVQLRELEVSSPKLPEDATEEQKSAFETDKKKRDKAAAVAAAAAAEDEDSDDSSDCPAAGEAEFPDNALLLSHLATLKREAYELGTTFDGIHDWIALNIPDMKEADGVGVEIMDAVMEQVTSLSDSLRSVYELELKYVDDRSEMEVSASKYSDSPSHLARIVCHDSEAWDDIERGWRTLARASILLHTVLAKNMKKLRDPHAHRAHNLSM